MEMQVVIAYNCRTRSTDKLAPPESGRQQNGAVREFTYYRRQVRNGRGAASWNQRGNSYSHLSLINEQSHLATDTCSHVT